ncbi:MAG: tetratricopeptide repeat protein [Pirellulaceae bacterium]
MNQRQQPLRAWSEMTHLNHRERTTAFQRTRRLAFSAASFLFVVALASPGFAQLDRVYPTQGTVVSGTIAATNPNGVVIRVGGAERAFSLEQIDRVVFNREPGPLSDGRSLVQQGQFDAALTQLSTIKLDDLPPLVKADVQFYTNYSQSKMALAGQGDKGAAIKNMLAFLGTKEGRESFHFYEAAKTLGDLALAVGSYENAVKYYTALSGAQSADLKLQSRYLVGWSLLRQKKVDEAGKAFSDVASANTTSPEQKRLQKLAAAGLANVAAAKGQPDQGLQELEKLVAESDPSDAELFARLFNAQGACFAAKSDPEGAVLAYLKTHLLFPSDPDSHSEALSELVQLWPQIGHAERANEARAILEKQYPGRN